MLSRTAVETCLSKSFADTLDDAFVTLLGVSMSRRDVVDTLQLANMIAVKRLEKTLARIKVLSPQQLAETDPMSLYRLKGVGETQVFVAMSLLDSHGFDPVSWWDAFDTKHRAKRRAKRDTHEAL